MRSAYKSRRFLRLKEDRGKRRNDTMCTFPEIAGDMVVPSFSKGTPRVDASVYERIRKKWEALDSSKK